MPLFYNTTKYTGSTSFFTTILGGLLSASTLASDANCKWPKPNLRADSATAGYTIENPGLSCLSDDIEVGVVFDGHRFEWRTLVSHLMLIGAFRIDIRSEEARRKLHYDVDMQAHTLKSRSKNVTGVDINWEARNVTLRNGTILTPGLLSGKGIKFIKTLPKVHILHGNGEIKPVDIVSKSDAADIPATQTADGKPPIYQETKFDIDKMTIHAGWRGVMIAGTNTILRNSTIEVDGHTSVDLYGPGSIIENNTIIIHAEGDANPFDAPIKLRDAHGAVIRNNRIIVKGDWSYKAPFAINLLDSTNVTIEGNTIESAEALVRSNGESQFTEINNTFK